MDITVTFPGNKKVDAAFLDQVVHTDQPVMGGGDGTAPTPFQLFLASLATCAGIYVLGFLQNRSIPSDGVSLVQHHEFDPETRKLTKVDLEILVPDAIPEKYHETLIRVASKCAVKNALQDPPEIGIAVKSV
jgi:ribosomal protein S12 methylthiotransferase accessory factor